MEQLNQVIFAGLDLAGAELKRLRVSFRCMVWDIAWTVASVILISVGLLLATAGLAVALVAALGWSGALLLAGAVLGGIGLLLARKPEPPKARSDVGTGLARAEEQP